jgi:pyruvate dehydrogenase E2 component (dihydrolipoamide acetyltransferase)
VQLRTQFNAGVEEGEKISFNDLVLRAVVVSLKKFPQLHSQWSEDAVTTPGQINLGVAVSLEEGLIVPVVKNAGEKSITALGQEVRELAGRARKGGLKPDEYQGGTFTVSNLGMYEITQFQAIINPPEAAILAVGAIRDTPVVDDGQVVPGKQMYLTISVDHRVVDGSVAAVFMQELKKRLQNPLSLLG